MDESSEVQPDSANTIVNNTAVIIASPIIKKNDESSEGLQTCLSKLSKLMKERLFHDALEECLKGLDAFPNNEKLLEKKIKILCHRGSFQEAYGLAESWLQRDPESAIAKKELNRLQVVINALADEDSDDEAQLSNPSEGDDEKRIPPDGMEIKPAFYSPPLTVQTSKDKTDSLPNGNADSPKVNPDKDETETVGSQNLKKKLNSESDYDWKYRPPPRGLTADEYSLCPRFADSAKCEFGHRCTLAHSIGEVEEWKERYKVRKQHHQESKEKQKCRSVYADQLLERLAQVENPNLVLTQNIDCVKVHVNSDLKVSMSSKRCTNAWTFTVTSKICLHHAAMLDDSTRMYFHISSISVGPKKTQKYQNLENHCQEWSNADVMNRAFGEYVYRIKVVFKTDIYGTFRQNLVFDFGSEPILSREMTVESAPVIDTDKLSKDLLLSEAGRWFAEKIKIVDFEPKIIPNTEPEKYLLSKYVLPQLNKFHFSDSLMHSPSKQNYRMWMHEMLYIEELAQLACISRFNMKVSLKLVNKFLLMPGSLSSAKHAQEGELFARLELQDDLTEDTSGGKLILLNCQSIWVAPFNVIDDRKNTHPEKVYEALVEDKGKNFIFFRFSKSCVQDLNLSCDQEFIAQIQFQLNRLSKCEMHAAVDKLPSLDMVFPDLASVTKSKCDREIDDKLEAKLNSKQKEAILAITTEPAGNSPPLLILGPYGTGKTYTLATAAMMVLKQPDTRILICTHSNSAADLYIKDFFHPAVVGGKDEVKPLRIYYKYRWIHTVSENVLQYCLLEKSGPQAGTFRPPLKEDVENHRVVVATLSTARYLGDIDLPKGYFTHIFIDEAAQSMECESLIPLAVADEKTKLVLAGDHMQLSPEVYSEFCKQQGFHRSLLERLCDMYPDDCASKIMLRENYRSHEAIIDFTSDLFYDGKLITSGKHPVHELFHPLTFFTARGEEVQHMNSTGYYNNAEVYEIVERVDELQRSWPSEWGEFNATSIGVVAPYSDQVFRIRAELRKRKMFNVSVERVYNVQGKQFRAIFISTVRTRHKCNTETSMEEYTDYGFLSNMKLLNTAITRSQSLVAVVGDPVSLCLVGKCRKIWEQFLETCKDNDSLHGITWTQLRSLLDGAEMTKTYVLNPLAPEFVPNRLFHITRTPADGTESYSQYGTIPTQYLSKHHQPTGVGSSPAYQYMYPYSPYMIPQYYPVQSVYPNMQGYAYYKQPYSNALMNRRPGSPYRNIPVKSSSPTQTGRQKLPADVEKSRSESPSSQNRVQNRVPTHVKGKTLVYLPRLPLGYSPYMPLFSPYYIQDEARLPANLHGLKYYSSQNITPAQPVDLAQRTATQRVEFPQRTPTRNMQQPTPPAERLSNSPQINREAHSVSPASSPSGQAFQVLPNVKHVPNHLINKEEQSDSSRSNTPQQILSTSTSEEGIDELSRTPQPIVSKPGPYDEVSSDEDEPRFHHDILNDEQNELKNKMNSNKKSLHLNTGFSRQFSDDLGTPTEITDIVRMIEESIEEEPTTPQADDPSIMAVIHNTKKAMPFSQQSRSADSNSGLKLNIPSAHSFTDSASSGSSSDSPSSASLRMTYAGALRKSPPAWSQGYPSYGKSDFDVSNFLEPQTPRTPAGFITPTEGEMDPLGILKNLNIDGDNSKYYS